MMLPAQAIQAYNDKDTPVKNAYIVWFWKKQTRIAHSEIICNRQASFLDFVL